MIFARNILILLLRLVINIFCRIIRVPFRFEFDHIRILEKSYKKNADFYFIQVGANDGVQYDGLYQFVKERNSKGLAIEPVKEYYDQLVNNYAFNKQIITINKAVHANKKEVVLYKVDPDKLHLFPHWAKGIASLDAAHHKKSAIPIAAMITEKALADDFMSIYNQYFHYNNIDLIQIDVEGYDYEVLKLIDFKTLKPNMIKLEYKNLSAAEIQESISLLKANKFYCFFQTPDLIGIKLHKLIL